MRARASPTWPWTARDMPHPCSRPLLSPSTHRIFCITALGSVMPRACRAIHCIFHHLLLAGDVEFTMSFWLLDLMFSGIECLWSKCLAADCVLFAESSVGASVASAVDRSLRRERECERA